jgi:hypothetical protein
VPHVAARACVDYEVWHHDEAPQLLPPILSKFFVFSERENRLKSSKQNLGRIYGNYNALQKLPLFNISQGKLGLSW